MAPGCYHRDMIVDLSHRIEPGMPAYPGLPEPKFHVFLAHDEPAKQTHYAPGVTFQIAAYEFGGNTGTYVDSPFHRHPNGADLAALPLKKLADLPGLLISAPEDGPIDEKAFRGVRADRIRNKAVLIRTGWSQSLGRRRLFPVRSVSDGKRLRPAGQCGRGAGRHRLREHRRHERSGAPGTHQAAGRGNSDCRASARVGAVAGTHLPILRSASGDCRRHFVHGAGVRGVQGRVGV